LGGAVQRQSQVVQTFVASLLATFLLPTCSQPPSDIIELPLSAVDGFSMENHPAPIEAAYSRYKDAVIAIEGIRLGPGLPAGLGSHQYVGLHQPPAPYEIAVEDWQDLPQD
jgi:hypothetical protein